MTTNRRDFLQTTALASSAILAGSGIATAADESETLKACVIGDSPLEGPANNTAYHIGYGHQLDRAFIRLDGVEIVAVADPREETRERALEITEAESDYEDYQEMLDAEKPDLVAIGTNRAARHVKPALAALEAGAHLFIEKPLCTSLEEADAIIGLADKKNLKIAVAHQYRPHPSIQHVKKLLDEGAIGELMEMRGRGKEDHRAGGEDLMVLGTHIFDLMQFFAGKPVWCSASVLVDGRDITPEDVHEVPSELGPLAGNQVSAHYLFDSGVMAHFDTRKTADGNKGRWGLELCGSKGIISMRMNQKPHVSLFTGASWAPMADGQKEEGKWVPLPDDPGANTKGGPNALLANNRRIVEDLLDAIKNDRRPAMGGHEARTALEMILAPYASQIAGGRVAIPMQDRRHPLSVFVS